MLCATHSDINSISDMIITETIVVSDEPQSALPSGVQKDLI